MRWRRIALVAGILVVAGGISAAGWGLFAYNEVTKVDRTNPKVVTDEYLRAALVRKDKAGADLYACSSQGALASIDALRADLDNEERVNDVSILVDWGAYIREGDTLTTELTITARKGVVVDSREKQTWRFTLVNDGGWRVCGAERLVTQPNPTPTTTR